MTTNETITKAEEMRLRRKAAKHGLRVVVQRTWILETRWLTLIDDRSSLVGAYDSWEELAESL